MFKVGKIFFSGYNGTAVQAATNRPVIEGHTNQLLKSKFRLDVRESYAANVFLESEEPDETFPQPPYFSMSWENSKIRAAKHAQIRSRNA